MRKNRWAAELLLALAPFEDDATRVQRRVDMVGDKHFAILDEIAEHMSPLLAKAPTPRSRGSSR
jgi:hypothetical protein